jgi:hypothetical protein
MRPLAQQGADLHTSGLAKEVLAGELENSSNIPELNTRGGGGEKGALWEIPLHCHSPCCYLGDQAYFRKKRNIGH